LSFNPLTRLVDGEDERKSTKDIENEVQQEIGFHKPLSGVFFNYSLIVVAVLINLGINTLFLGYIFPYPESQGYNSLTGIVFGLMFRIFDIGTAYGIERWIAEYRIKNPLKMVRYIQFFIWYQMITGLIQVTWVSYYALYVFRENVEFSYLSWLFLILATTQYPGMLSIFKSCLTGFQEFKSWSIVAFISNMFISKAFELSFALIGRSIGAANPAIGELYGASIGLAIGGYLQSFFSMLLAMRYAAPVLGKFGFRIRDTFSHNFDWEIMKTCLWFGIKVSVAPIYGTFVGWMISLWFFDQIPQYATFLVLSGLAGQFASGADNGSEMNITPSISESFNNKKLHLSQFYIAQAWKWYGVLTSFFVVLLLLIFPVIVTIFSNNKLQNYSLMIPFFYSHLIPRIFSFQFGKCDDILIASGHETFLMIIRFIEENLKLFILFLLLFVFKVQNYGFGVIVWLLPCNHLPAATFKAVMAWWFINKKVVKLNVAPWQTFVAPGLAGTIYYYFGQLCIIVIYNPLVLLNFFLGFIVYGLIVILIGVGYVFFPLYAFFGGWDEYGLSTFEKGKVLTGPSKFLVAHILKVSKYMNARSPFYNKFPIPWVEADREAKELQSIRDHTDKYLMSQISGQDYLEENLGKKQIVTDQDDTFLYIQYYG
jgi:hypothetical protein